MDHHIDNLLRLESYKATEAHIPSALSVVVVDDEPLMVELLSRTLKMLGHEVIGSGGDGQAALDLARKHRPDLMILDLIMPQCDGMEAAERILAEMSVPIILSTGRTDDETLQRAKKANIQVYLVKPFHKEQLKSAIAMALANHHAMLSAQARIAELKNELNVVKMVDLAVELLMEKFRIDRRESLEKLEAAARARTCTLVEAAKAIATTLSPQRLEAVA
jgi:AmiR/NasT family two-component response regulator